MIKTVKWSLSIETVLSKFFMMHRENLSTILRDRSLSVGMRRQGTLSLSMDGNDAYQRFYDASLIPLDLNLRESWANNNEGYL